MKKDRPLYQISIVAEMLNFHPQTIRLYEREGFIKPKRRLGNVRLFSQDDVERIEMILRLTRRRNVRDKGPLAARRFQSLYAPGGSTADTHVRVDENPIIYG